MKRDPKAASFDLVAEDYRQVRPGYPVAAVEHVISSLRLTGGSRVVEMGPGPGVWTSLLAPRVGEVYAVEPSSTMRRELSAAFPAVSVVNGVAEDTGLDAGRFDAVMAAQAFHWFRSDAVFDEIARLLGTSGGLAVIYNERDPADPATEALSELLRPHRRGFPSGDRRWRTALEADPRFELMSIRRFPNPHTLKREELSRLLATMSFVAAMPGEQREELCAQADAIFSGVPIVIHNQTEVTLARLV